MTCDRLHALTLIAYLQLCHWSATCIHILSYVLLFSYLFVLLSCILLHWYSVAYVTCYLIIFYICSCSYYHICTWFLLHEFFPLYTHTHYGRILTTLDLHVQLLDDCSNVQVFVGTVRNARSWTLSLSLIPVYLHFILVMIL